MSDLGDLLREARESQGLSLEQVETDTRIRHRFLVALESGVYEALPGQVYVKGFLRTYASYLGLDAEQVLGLYAATVGAQEAKPLPSVPLVEVDMEGPRDLRPIVRVLAVVAVLAVLVAVYVRAPWRTWLGLQPSPVASPTATQPAATPEPSPTPTRQPTATRTAALTATPAPSAEVRVQFVVTGRSWVQVLVDGQVAYAGLLENEAHEWVGSDRIVARIGNAGAVDVTVNGQHLGTLGNEGDVIVQEWVAEGTSAP
jgi:cytoskeletal protein RodZ